MSTMLGQARNSPVATECGVSSWVLLSAWGKRNEHASVASGDNVDFIGQIGERIRVKRHD